MNSWANNGDKSSSHNKKDAQYVQTSLKVDTKKEEETLIVEQKEKMVTSAYKDVQEELAREEFDKLVHPKDKADNAKDTEPK